MDKSIEELSTPDVGTKFLSSHDQVLGSVFPGCIFKGRDDVSPCRMLSISLRASVLETGISMRFGPRLDPTIALEPMRGVKQIR